MLDLEPNQVSAIHSVDRALLVVELLMREPGALSARVVADRVGINRTTAHRLLNALIERGWVQRLKDGAGYQLGLKFLALASVSAARRDLLREIRPALEEVSAISRETVHIGVMDGFEVVHVDKVESPERVRVSSSVGSRASAHTTALGKALLAAMPDGFLDDYLAYSEGAAPPLRRADARTLREEIEETRRRGYSVDDEDDAVGVRCVGAPVLGPGREPMFALSITGPSQRLTLERIEELVPMLIRVSGNLSRALGVRPAGMAEGDPGDRLRPRDRDRVKGGSWP